MIDKSRRKATSQGCGDIPIFMKESLRELMGDDFKQQFPWEAPK